MKLIRLVYKLLAFLLLCTCAWGATPSKIPSPSRLQELRTSSVNWPDSAFLPADPISRQKYVAVKQPKRKIFVDAGHGGKDEGAIGWGGITEKIVSLRIARLVKSEIERRALLLRIPVEVKISRESDNFLSLKERVTMANTWGADAFISLHCNSSTYPRAKGFEVYFLSAEGSDDAARKLARAENDGESPVQSQVLSILSDAQTTQHVSESSPLAESLFQSVSRGIHSNGRGVRQAPFAVLSGTTMPAVLLEIGYLTNASEAQKLGDGGYLKRLADAISTGIVSFVQTEQKL
jgi:N-acetylmuramoyl-L-alanine amidase